MHENENAQDGLSFFQRFVHSEVSGSLVLVACALAALAWANSPWSSAYFDLIHTKVSVSWGERQLAMSLQHWVNDFLMVLFFFVVGLEIKRELVVGHLSSVRRAVLPAMAAFGGMVVPAAIYGLLNAGGEGQAGWGIPMATDIAFALGVLALFGKRVPLALKVFLTALAIADDLGAVLVIAFFYTETIFLTPLLVAAVFLFFLLLATKAHLRRPGFYFLLAVGVWGGVLASGIHATVAGILVAFVVPIRARVDPQEFLRTAHRHLTELRSASLTRESMLEDRTQLDAIFDLDRIANRMKPPGLSLEEYFHPVQAFFVLPLFGLFNAGVALDTDFFGTLTSPVSLGIVLGLVLGKQVGITLFSWIAVRSGYASLPAGIGWLELYGASCLAGIGFTMSLFISDLAFDAPALLTQAKVGILAGSILAGVLGYAVIAAALRRSRSRA